MDSCFWGFFFSFGICFSTLIHLPMEPEQAKRLTYRANHQSHLRSIQNHWFAYHQNTCQLTVEVGVLKKYTQRHKKTMQNHRKFKPGAFVFWDDCANHCTTVPTVFKTICPLIWIYVRHFIPVNALSLVNYQALFFCCCFLCICALINVYTFRWS